MSQFSQLSVVAVTSASRHNGISSFPRSSTLVLVLCPFSLFGCVCQPKINEYDDDDDDDDDEEKMRLSDFG